MCVSIPFFMMLENQNSKRVKDIANKADNQDGLNGQYLEDKFQNKSENKPDDRPDKEKDKKQHVQMSPFVRAGAHVKSCLPVL